MGRGGAGGTRQISATCGRKWGSSVPRRCLCPPPRQNVVTGERGGWVIHGLRLTVDKPAAHWFGRRLEITDRAFTVYFSRGRESARSLARLYPSSSFNSQRNTSFESIHYLVLSTVKIFYRKWLELGENRSRVSRKKGRSSSFDWRGS